MLGAAAVLVVLAAFAVALVQIDDVRDDAQSEVAGLEATVEQQREALEEQRTAANALNRRLAAIEAENENRPKPAVVARTVQASVFRIEVGDIEGSAWVMASSGGRSTLVTNHHVVENAQGEVRLHKGDATWLAKVDRVNVSADLALLTVTQRFEPLARARRLPSVGDSVMAVGSPLGLEGTVTQGIVSSLREEASEQYIQFSAQVSPGSSGGPLVNEQAEVIGVTVAKAVAVGAEGLSFAIPVRRVCDALDAC